MNLESQVCSLELSKKLKEMGIKQESYFYWYEIHDCVSLEDYKWRSDISGKMPYSAFTSSELGKLLPFSIKWQNHQCYLGSMFGYTKFGYTSNVHYHYHYGEDIIAFDFVDENEANARAQMLIYLIENKLMEIK